MSSRRLSSMAKRMQPFAAYTSIDISVGVAADGLARYSEFGVGDLEAGNYLRYDTDNGLELSGGGGVVTFDDNGIGITVSDLLEPERAYRLLSGTAVMGELTGISDETSEDVNLRVIASGGKMATMDIEAESGSAAAASIVLAASRTGGVGHLIVTASGDGAGAGVLGGLAVGGNEYTQPPAEGTIRYTGQLAPVRNDISYTGRVFVPLTVPLTSTAWDGDARSTSGPTALDLPVTFGTPASAKAVAVRATIRDSGSAGADCAFSLGLVAGAELATSFVVRCSGLANDAYSSASGIVPCDIVNGNISYQVVASGSGTMDVTLEIVGYWL